MVGLKGRHGQGTRGVAIPTYAERVSSPQHRLPRYFGMKCTIR